MLFVTHRRDSDTGETSVAGRPQHSLAPILTAGRTGRSSPLFEGLWAINKCVSTGVLAALLAGAYCGSSPRN